VRSILDFKDAPAREQVKVPALRFGLEPALVAAFVMQESAGDPYAWRPEAKWRYYWDVKQNRPFRKLYPGEINSEVAPEDFPSLGGSGTQEWAAQAASWGLMQVMGAVARERGFRGPYLTALCDPPEGLSWGCQTLAYLLNRFGGGGISAYNAGSPCLGSKYEKSVLAWRDKLRPLFVST